MSDLIKREDALLECCRGCRKDNAHGCTVPCPEYMNISNLPAVDAVEVVRCKDCVHCRMSYDPKRKISDQVCGFVGYNPIQSSCVTDDFFCPYGERRSE